LATPVLSGKPIGFEIVRVTTERENKYSKYLLKVRGVESIYTPDRFSQWR